MTSLLDPILELALAEACGAAENHRGATAPNPPVGAAALNSRGELLCALGHEKAGAPHAEARVIEALARDGRLAEIDTLIVTLEPCNHFGRTPPCALTIAKLPQIKRVFYAFSDPHPKAQGGAAFLREQGIKAESLSAHDRSPALQRARELCAPFFHQMKTGRPWVTIKRAFRETPEGLTMIPANGQKTFTSRESLRFAHALRKRADAIITGSGTVLMDAPEFTVRHVPDHIGKSRWLVMMDRSDRVPGPWLEARKKQGFKIHVGTDFSAVLDFLGSQGVLEALVEAGPTLSDAVLRSGLWNESYRILHHATPGIPDSIQKESHSESY